MTRVLEWHHSNDATFNFHSFRYFAVFSRYKRV